MNKWDTSNLKVSIYQRNPSTNQKATYYMENMFTNDTVYEGLLSKKYMKNSCISISKKTIQLKNA